MFLNYLFFPNYVHKNQTFAVSLDKADRQFLLEQETRHDKLWKDYAE